MTASHDLAALACVLGVALALTLAHVWGWSRGDRERQQLAARVRRLEGRCFDLAAMSELDHATHRGNQ